MQSYSDAGLPYLQLPLLGYEPILWAFRRKGWRTGLPVLSGCSGSASSSSSTPSQCSACCYSAHQTHTRGLSLSPPGMWISVKKHKYIHTHNWAGVSSSLACTGAPVHAIKNWKETQKKVDGHTRAHTKWTKTSLRAYSWNTSILTNMLNILVLLLEQWKLWISHQLSYVNSTRELQCGPLIKPPLSQFLSYITVYWSKSSKRFFKHFGLCLFFRYTITHFQARLTPSTCSLVSCD